MRSSIVILARYRNQLEVINNALREVGVTGVIGQRRDDFSSPHFAWLDASLRQAAFPLDQRNLRVFIESFNKLAAIEISVDAVISESETTSKNYIETWNNLIQASAADATYKALASAVLNLSTNTRQYKKFVADSLREFKRMSDDQPENFDIIDDISAWASLSRDIGQSLDGDAELHEFTQELSMRSKEPPLRPNCVMLMTIHGSKGKEFDYVYLVGAIESTLPTYQSMKAGDTSPEMEEERRSCFVAITRTEECLTITWSDKSRGYNRQPSRFLLEMGLVERASAQEEKLVKSE